MKIEFTPEQQLLQQTARRFFEQEVPTDLVKKLQEPESTGHSDSLWQAMVNIGWLGMYIPEDYGGGGSSLLDLGIIYEESGQALVPTTFYSTTHAAILINSLGTKEQKQQYLPDIAKGELIATVAYAEPDAIHDPNCFKTIAKKVNNNWVLSGTKMFVPNAHIADYLVVIAQAEVDGIKEGLIALVIPSNLDGMLIKPLETFGKDRQSVIEFNDVEINSNDVLGSTTEDISSKIDTVLKKVTALQCLEMVGGSNKVIEMTVKYVSERIQFGVPIGSFQAVQHHLANMKISVEGSRLLAYQAISLLSEGKTAHTEVAMSKAHASETYKSVTLMAHQLWGGMGYVTESDLYLWSNRAKATELSFGTQDIHLNYLADQIV